MRIGQTRLLGGDVIPFGRAKRQAIELAELPFESFARGIERAGILFGEGELTLDFTPSFPCESDLLTQRLVGAMRIHHVTLTFGAQQTLMRMLAVDVDQVLTHFAELGDRDGRAVDVCAASALRIHHAAQDKGVFGAQVVFGEPLGERGRHIKNRANFGACRACAQYRSVRAFAQGECQRVDENRFARTGFARKHRKAMIEVDLGFGDDHEITNVKRAQHASVSVLARLWEPIPVQFAAQG